MLEACDVTAQAEDDETGKAFAGMRGAIHTGGAKGAVEAVFFTVGALGSEIGPAAGCARVKKRRGVAITTSQRPQGSFRCVVDVDMFVKRREI